MIERIPYPNALFTEMNDYVKQNNLIETGFLRVNDPWPIVGGNIAKGSVFQLGGTVYLATSDTAIGGAASDYVKLTPSGDGSTLAPTYVANLGGVSWNQVYNGYYDVGGNLYVFDEMKAYFNGIIPNIYTISGKNAITIKESFFNEIKISYRNKNGGSATSGAWNVIPWNTTDYNEIVGASLLLNQIILPHGVYKFRGYCEFHDTSNVDFRLYNITDGLVEKYLGGAICNFTYSVFVSVSFEDRIEIPSEKTFQLEYLCSATKATDGLGGGRLDSDLFERRHIIFQRNGT